MRFSIERRIAERIERSEVLRSAIIGLFSPLPVRRRSLWRTSSLYSAICDSTELLLRPRFEGMSVMLFAGSLR